MTKFKTQKEFKISQQNRQSEYHNYISEKGLKSKEEIMEDPKAVDMLQEFIKEHDENQTKLDKFIEASGLILMIIFTLPIWIYVFIRNFLTGREIGE